MLGNNSELVALSLPVHPSFDCSRSVSAGQDAEPELFASDGHVLTDQALRDLNGDSQAELRSSDMATLNASVVCISAESCPGFLRAVFSLYEKQQLFAVVRQDVADDPRLAGTDHLVLEDGPRAGWFRTGYTLSHSDAPAQIVFSSGTEGRPKAILLTHRNLSDVVERLNAVMHVTSDIREYVGVPVTYSFGLGRVRSVMAVGGSVYVPEKFNPSEIRRMLEKGEINALSVVPSLCRILLNSAEMFEGIGNRIRWIEIGSQYMAADDKAAMRRLFQNARIVQHYGLTEASRSTFLDISEARPEHLDSVGPVEELVDIRIDPEGAVCIRGNHVARYQLLTATELAPLTDDQGWLITKDRGEIRNGHLYFLGRMDDQINVAGVKLGSEHLEQRITLALPQVAGHFAVVAMEDQMRGQLPLIAIERDRAEFLPQIEKAMASAMAFYGVSGGEVFRSMLVDHLPVTGSGKVQRAQLRDLHKSAAMEKVRRTWGRSKVPTSVEEVYQSHFPNTKIDPETTFETAGGDSLNYISVSLELERLLGELPESWGRMTLAELEKARSRKHFSMESEAALGKLPARPASSQPNRRLVLGKADTLRAVACLLVVTLHVFGADPTSGLQFPADSAWRVPFEVLELLRIPLFTALAGLLYGALPSSHPGLSSFLKQRALTLLLPAFAVSVIYFTIRSLMGKEQGSLLSELLNGYLHLWYLYALFGIVACVGTIDALCRPRTETWLLIAVVLYLLHPVTPWIRLFAITADEGLAPYFILGLILYRRPGVLGHAPLIYAAAIVGVGGLILRFATATGEMRLTPVEELLIYPLASIGLIFLTVRFFPRIPRLEWLGLYSYAIYLWHPLCNATLRTVSQFLGVNHPAVLFCLGTIAGVIVPIWLFSLAKRLPRLARYALVGR
jgi:acyl-CoA synthetase (AMP-forming)/AMP-acid ligase II/peptidoglycan/LPS O-acetylase OafA/YrhL